MNSRTIGYKFITIQNSTKKMAHLVEISLLLLLAATQHSVTAQYIYTDTNPYSSNVHKPYYNIPTPPKLQNHPIPMNYWNSFAPYSTRYNYEGGGPPIEMDFPPFRPLRSFNESVYPTQQRDSKLLPLFTVVQFPKHTCTSSSGDNGTCLTPPDCLASGGIPTGPCAKNFGICCVKMTTCGHVIRDNGTYFVNKGYPMGYNQSGSCQVTINKKNADICQYRLDFEQFSIAGPEPMNHNCNYDQFIVTGSTNVPSICGYNSGQHMYIDAGVGTNNPVTLSVITSGPEFSRNWKIRILQIPCSNNYKADDGCLQYYSTISGVIKSFNYEPVIGLHLSNQDYTICIRSERNFCGIQYSQCADTANNRTHSFSLTGNTIGQNAVESMTGSTSCNTDWLMIPCVANIGGTKTAESTCVDRLCGGTLNAEVNSVPSFVYSSVKPYRLVFHTNNVESANEDMGNRGFCLNYVQQPCISNIGISK